MSQIDSIDERILGELQANGRLTMKALAEHIGLSSPAMIERVRRLEDRGVISGYRAIVAPESLGRPIATMILARLNNGSEPAFTAAVQDNSSITEMHRLTGAWTHVIRAHVSGMTELESLVGSLRAAGAVCESSIITSSPVIWRAMLPLVGPSAERPRTVRRGRPALSDGEEIEETPAAPRRRGPGRPRIRRAES